MDGDDQHFFGGYKPANQSSTNKGFQHGACVSRQSPTIKSYGKSTHF